MEEKKEIEDTREDRNGNDERGERNEKGEKVEYSVTTPGRYNFHEIQMCSLNLKVKR